MSTVIINKLKIGFLKNLKILLACNVWLRFIIGNIYNKHQDIHIMKDESQ